jgi:hypothetical protein
VSPAAPLVEDSLGGGQPGADRMTAPGRRGRSQHLVTPVSGGPRLTLHVRRRDDQAGVDREKTDPEQPRNDGRFDE